MAHDRFAASLEVATDSTANRPSLLQGWSVAHVVTHLARNAQAMVLRIEAARRGELIEQYSGGPQGRADEIAAGSRRPPHEIFSDAITWSKRLDSLFDSLPDEAWSWPVRTVGGAEHAVGLLPFRRWREVEVHHVDLGIGFEPADWSPGLVDQALPRLLDRLPDRADRSSLAAWMLGRGAAPDLEPWG